MSQSCTVKPDDYAPREKRIAYMAPVVARAKGWKGKAGEKRAAKLLDETGGYGGYTYEAWIRRAMEAKL